MERNGRRPLTLLVIAGLLVAVGLMSAMSAPGAPPKSNKADAYGGPVTPPPTNPKTPAACHKYYGTNNPTPESRQCLALAKRNAGNAKCAKLKGARKVACKKAVSKRYKSDLAKIAKQRRAEKACTTKYNSEFQSLDPDAPDYDQKLQAASDELAACYKKARGG